MSFLGSLCEGWRGKGGGGSEERRYGRWGMGGNLSCPYSFQSYFLRMGGMGGIKKKWGREGVRTLALCFLYSLPRPSTIGLGNKSISTSHLFHEPLLLCVSERGGLKSEVLY